MKRYCLVPGWVRSINDGDRHYISAISLMKLYGVRANECVQHSDPAYDCTALEHLAPRYDGNYERKS